jgi:hypothetical protein
MKWAENPVPFNVAFPTFLFDICLAASEYQHEERNSEISRAVALWTGKVGCSELNQKYSFTGMPQDGMNVYQSGVPLRTKSASYCR